MEVVALVSGGKDSCYAMMKCQQYGHKIVALANLMPCDEEQDELDSYMYQTVGHQIVVSYAQCMGIPLFRRRIQGSTRNHGLSYNVTPGDEVEDMLILLKEVKRQIPSVSAVSSGAIASDYQRLRVENICSRLGLVSLAYLWKQDQSLLLQEMITSGIVAIIVKVAAIGLDPLKHLGTEVALLRPHLHKLKELYGINVCGEGGEYETLTLDCPLFKNAQIVIDKFEVVLHSAGQIAPVGVLHPVEYHLETKLQHFYANDDGITNGAISEEVNSVCEVLEDCLHISDDYFHEKDSTSDSVLDTTQVHISISNSNSNFSLTCFSRRSSTASTDLEEDLEFVLKRIELLLAECNCTWENVLYIHLYIADMNNFSKANDKYVKFITHERCRFGVPSRSTVELPLLQAGLGKVYVEALVSKDNSKNVLHVQSISEWAPSCIGPYSQATLHKDVLYMAGQLGLNPPTMLLSSEGPELEFQKALENCEAVAQCFNASISTSAIMLLIYCSPSLKGSDKIAIDRKKNVFLEQMKRNLNMERGSRSRLVNTPVVLYILVADLPKRATVEVKPKLYCGESSGYPTAGFTKEILPQGQSYWGFRHETWHENCLQKCIVNGVLCAAAISITKDAQQLISTSMDPSLDHSQHESSPDNHGTPEFCIWLLDSILVENHFSWKDVMLADLFLDYPRSKPWEMDNIIYQRIQKFGEMSNRFSSDVPLFSLVPVLGAGRSAECVGDDVLTCELFARKF